MKKLKLAAVSLLICAAALTGYKIYNNTTMSDLQKLLMQNVEALARTENLADCIASNCCWKEFEYCDYDCNGKGWSSSNMINCH